MSCIITYKGKQYSEQQFKEYFINNKNEFATSIAKNKDVIDSFKRKMEAIQEVFNANPELSKIGDVFSYAIYLNTIFPDSKVKDIVYHGTNADLSKGFSKEFSGKGSGSPIMRGDIYTTLQPETTLQYIAGIGTIQSNKLWTEQHFELKRLIDIEKRNIPITENIINKTITTGKWRGKSIEKLKEEYNFTGNNIDFLKEVYGIIEGESFNEYKKRKQKEFKDIWKNKKYSKAPYSLIVNIQNPLTHKTQDTDYTDFIKQAERQGNDGLVMYDNNDAFRSDVVVAFKPEQIHILGSNKDIEGFKQFVKSPTISKEVEQSKDRTIAIIGTAGRSQVPTLTEWNNMLKDAEARVNPNDVLISGGAAFADHIAVKLFLEGKVKGLKLRLPAKIKDGKFVGGYGTAGGTANYYHAKFDKITGGNSIKEIEEAIAKGAEVTYETETSNKAMFIRNAKVAKESNSMLAYTYGEGNEPTDGGTKNTWDSAKYSDKTHVPISKIKLSQPTKIEQPTVKVDVKGIEINSYQTGLGNDLTNVHYANKEYPKSKYQIIPSNKDLKLTQAAKSKWGESVEAWYKSNQSKTKGIPEGEQADKYDFDLMVGLITDKLTQYPNLVEQINQKGGLEFLQKSTHNMGTGRWSSKNPKNMFMNSLIQAYKNASQTPSKEVENKTEDWTQENNDCGI